MRLLITFIFAATLFSCQSQTEKAFSIKNDIGEQTSIINQAATTAQIKITQADAKVVAWEAANNA